MIFLSTFPWTCAKTAQVQLLIPMWNFCTLLFTLQSFENTKDALIFVHAICIICILLFSAHFQLLHKMQQLK
jgi:hypothetical protein